MAMNSLITFIIPTINRSTLINTLESLEKQTDPNWKAICVFDNIIPGDNIKLKLESDSRFKYIVLSEKLGKDRNSAGMVRNIGIEKADTEWIGFVDDDDTLTPYYVQRLKEELVVSPDIECIIFRMCLDNNIFPTTNAIDFEKGQVGISFCYKLKLFNENLKFIPDSFEDFLLLNRIRSNKKNILISPYITYLVRSIVLPENNEQTNTRIFINGDKNTSNVVHSSLYKKANIMSAIYGANNTYINVLPIILDILSIDNNICITNNIFTDPLPQVEKKLIIIYIDGNVIVINENTIAHFNSD